MSFSDFGLSTKYNAHEQQYGIQIGTKSYFKSCPNLQKMKYMDDLVVAEVAKITALRDQWLIQ